MEVEQRRGAIKRMATTQQSKVKLEKMKEAEVKAERLGVKAEVEEEIKAEAETIKETEVERRFFCARIWFGGIFLNGIDRLFCS